MSFALSVGWTTHLQQRYSNAAGSVWVEERCTARGLNRTATPCTRVYMCMLLFTGWMQTQGPSSNSCGAVCETVIVSGKLSQKSLCSSGLKAAGVEGRGVKLNVKFSVATWCVQRWSQRWNSKSESVFPPAAAEYLKGPKLTRTPEWAARGRSLRPRLERWPMLQSRLLCHVPPAPSRLITALGLACLPPPPILKMDGYFLHVFSLVMDCLLTALLPCIYLNVVLQMNTCSLEEISGKNVF